MNECRTRKRVLFICTHNSARSQMAEGILNALLGHRYEANSAGTEPTEIDALAIKVMAEIGIDISKHRAKNVGEFQNMLFDYVVTVCDYAKESCPFFPGDTVIHKSFDDPESAGGPNEKKLAEFRKIRDEIKNWILEAFGRDAGGEISWN